MSGSQATHTESLSVTCHQCNAAFEYRQQLYWCSQCPKPFCSACVFPRRGAAAAITDVPSVPVGEPLADIHDSVSAALPDDDWRVILAKLPERLSCPTLRRVPRGLDRRYARARLLTIEWMLQGCRSCLPDGELSSLARLAWALPWLLLHDPRVAEKDEGSGEAVTVRKRVLERLSLFEEGKWGTLISQALDFAFPRQMSKDFPSATDPEAPLDPKVVEQACSRAADGSLKAAVRVLNGSRPLPPTAATRDAILELYPTGDHPTSIEDSCRGVRAAGPVPVRAVTARLHALRGTAHAGPNGERNTHLKALTSSPRGPRILADWCTAWRNFMLPAAVRQVFLQCLVVPLDKGGGKARPIVLQEALLKLATGTAASLAQRRIESAVLPEQHGAGRAGGAARMSWGIRAAMSSSPDLVFVGVDMRNAFGTMSRTTVIQEAAEVCPDFACCLRSLWSGASPRLLIDGPGDCQAWSVTDSLTQGGCDAAPAFCLGLRRVIRSLKASCARDGIDIQLWAYMDDIVFCAHPAHIARIMGLLDSEARRAGLQRRPDKCHWYCPSGAAHCLPDTVGKHAPDGLPILGSVAEGAYASILSNTTDMEHPQLAFATRRQKDALTLIQQLRKVLESRAMIPVRHAVWKLLVGVVNEALSFDLCVLPPAIVLPLAQSLDAAINDLFSRIVQMPPDQIASETGLRALTLARLPRSAGGCGMLAYADRAYTAFLATVIGNAPLMHDSGCREAAGIPAHAQECINWLEQAGVHLDEWGMPQDSRPLRSLCASSLPAICMPKRQREWWRQLSARRACLLSPTVPWLSSQAGLEGGMWLTSTVSEVGVAFMDDEFVVALRMRLRLPVCADIPCARHAIRSGRRCGQALDPDGHHAVLCKLCGLSTVLHDACCRRLWQAAKQSGALALREQVIPELADPVRKEPRVDIETWGLPNEMRGLYDFTICAPFAVRYGSGATAVAAAEARKRREYPSVAGLAVTGIAADTFGRIGPALSETLERWADHARMRDISAGIQPRRWLRTWRAQLSTEIALGVARMVILSQRRAIPCAGEDAPARLPASIY